MCYRLKKQGVHNEFFCTICVVTNCHHHVLIISCHVTIVHRSTLVCPGCGRQSDKLEPFLFVSLPIPTSATSTSSHGRTSSRRPVLNVNVIVVRQLSGSCHEPAVRHRLQLSSSRRSTVAKLKRLITDRTDIPHRKVCWLHVLGSVSKPNFLDIKLSPSVKCNARRVADVSIV